ncbi:MAG: hypothetical protein ABSB19_10310 [Methylomonas sp.]|jgi:hypothetical protein
MADSLKLAAVTLQSGQNAPHLGANRMRVVATPENRYPGCFRIAAPVCDFDGNKLAEAAGLLV